ncbi:ABC transporter substrate-binding protein [Tanticharoenia sakaeratensis]|uniref:Thiamine pyrimidine synthase n=1 Tax=Tanticharoenia sakaeratensis NBRC 103193 TaxID=1231623 RepID=A0A0D6MLY5_9PROT|nr:ABC transporter substrate-binding protein [Tanticharoenia sakaeratensis]GAN54456.1 ABC transporter substrate-binding protein [Tanticharoenia sakaeratensis NBRC 103193]GBQ24177.1 nitrate/sulfonate/bicarbonate ABC transporter substrate-binding periplasmic protein [Tanticharoenia sakaeratensis NBRC 103193]
MNRRGFISSCMAGSLVGGRRAFSDTPLRTCAYQLSWIKNFQGAGEYIASEKGFFRDEGLDVTLLAGGPTMPHEPAVMSGKALLAQTMPDNTVMANMHGATLKIIGAGYQKSPFCIASLLSGHPMHTPQDMVGRKIGVQSVNLVVWRTFLRLNHIDPASITVVPVQFDMAPLIAGDVDGFFGYLNDNVVHLEAAGHRTAVVPFAQFGYTLMGATLAVRADSLQDPVRRATLVSFMRADMRGWQAAIADPALGADLTVNDFGKGNGLDPKAEEQSCRASNALMVDADTNSKGLFWMSDAAVADAIRILRLGGLSASPDLFTNEILVEARAGAGTH